MQKSTRHIQHIVGIEILGFSLIILLTWLDELLPLPALLFGGEYHANYPEAIMETLIIMGVAIPVVVITKKLLNRLHYLEGFLQVCAWCRKVEHDGHWLVLEDYFQRRFNTRTSHGMCPECYRKVRAGNHGNAASPGSLDAAGEAACNN